MNIHKYFDVVLNNDQFSITETQNKPKSKDCALATLKLIEKVMNDHLAYVSQKDDAFSKLPDNLLRSKLVETARVIKAGYLEKASHASVFARFFGRISQKENEIETLCNRIENLASPPTFDLPQDLIKEVLSRADVKDIGVINQLSKKTNEIGKEAIIDKARKYGYEGFIYEEANDHLSKLFDGVNYLIKVGFFPKEAVVSEGIWPFNHYDIEAALKKFQALPPATIDTMKKRVGNHLEGILANLMDQPLIGWERRFQNIFLALQPLKINIPVDPLFHTAYQTVWIGSETLEMLLKHGANPNKEDAMGWTPLIHALKNQNSKYIKMFLENGADVNYINSKGVSPLLYALYLKASPEIIELLLDKGADINPDGRHLKHLRNAYLTIPIIKLLLDKGAGVAINSLDKKGRTLLHRAVIQNNKDLVEFLLKNGADPNIVTGDGKSIYDLANRSMKSFLNKNTPERGVGM